MRPFVQKIHQRAILIAETFHLSKSELIEVLQEMDQCHGYRDFDCTSLWAYGIKYLKLDENELSCLITVARKSIQVPELKEAVSDGRIHLSKAKRIVSVLTSENKSEWLEKAQILSKRDLERELAGHSPKLATQESVKYVNGTRVQFQCGLNEEDYQAFLDVQDLVSSKKQEHCDYEQTLKELVRFYKNANDPLMKAQRAQTRKIKKEAAQPCPGTVDSVPDQKTTNRKSYPAELEHQLNLRDQRQCTHQDSNGKRCWDKRWLNFHHKIEVEHGGQNTLENLQTLCWAHHKLVHCKSVITDRINKYQYVLDGT